MIKKNNFIFNFHDAPERKPQIGKLKSFGITKNHMAPLLLPKKYFDVRRSQIYTDFNDLSDHMDEKVLIGCKIVGEPKVDFSRKPTSVSFKVAGRNGSFLYLKTFGYDKDFIKALKTDPIFCFKGTVSEFRGQLQFKNPELINMKWVGRIMPIYAGKERIMKPETVQERIMNLVDPHLKESCKELRSKFKLSSKNEVANFLSEMGATQKTFEDLIKAIHLPETTSEGEYAQSVIKRMSALDMINRTKEDQKKNIVKDSALKIPHRLVQETISELPKFIKLTNDQYQAIDEAVEDINSNQPMRRLLTGDVGTGKSVPIAVLAASVAKMELNTTILMPNAPLAEQMRNDIENWWPNLKPKLVSTEVKGLPESRILVGTTALNFRIPDDYPIALHIIDEQQKMSVDQRLKLARRNTNVLEASATPVPRSLGLIKYGQMPISTLKEGHVENKRITERINNVKSDKERVFDRIIDSVKNGNKALIIYPLAEASVNEDEKNIGNEVDKKSVTSAFDLWEKFFPGRVRFVHGKLSDEEKFSAINALKNGDADILCSTTVVEVGLNVNNLRDVLIIHPERLGLSTIHQIRGRLARDGGIGHLTLYTPDEISEKSAERLDLLMHHNDGFELSYQDMRQRGVGDMNKISEMQSGHLDGFIPNAPISIEDIDYVVKLEEDKEKEREALDQQLDMR